MDAIADLAARASSFITLIQDIFVKGNDQGLPPERIELSDIFCQDFSFKIEKNLSNYIRQDLDELKTLDKKKQDLQGSAQQKERADLRDQNRLSNFDKRAIELVWISADEPVARIATEYTQEILVDLTAWIYANKEFLFRELKACGSLPTPYHWRDAISKRLYIGTVTTGELIEPAYLAQVLQYLPIQVVLALGGGGYDVKQQRLLQLWNPTPANKKKLLNEKEQILYDQLHQKLEGQVTDISLLINNSKILTEKLRAEIPLPFDLVFAAELEEIKKSRVQRYKERCAVNAVQRKKDEAKKLAQQEEMRSWDPAETAKAMQLYALALSGGGIRSATFNLGIMQGLAREGLIGQFDYLSTVSGGGYIGSWLAAWIQREGSVNKVSNRLSPEKSPDPFAEEVRPIRWLRMFSNYFTPQASIMSIDAWTVGVTWLRNTLLNQVIIALLLLSGLLAIRLAYEVWFSISLWNKSAHGMLVYMIAIILLLTLALLAGLGMRAYHNEKLTSFPIKRETTKGISTLILLVALVGSFVVSASFLWQKTGAAVGLSDSVFEKLILLMPACGAILFSLLLIAFLGKYENCVMSYGKSRTVAWVNITFAAAIAAAVATICLALGWQLLQGIGAMCESDKLISEHVDWLASYSNWLPGFYDRVAFIAGVPIVLLVFGITVVVRMALLGRYFPDERREWWGRMGAEITRAAFIFVLLAGSSLLGIELAKQLLVDQGAGWKVPATFGGWLALVGSTVKAAFSGKTSGKSGEKGPSALLLNMLSMAGPYIFALGLLVFLPALLIPLYRYNLFQASWIEDYKAVKTLALMLIAFISAFLLAHRVGVNEFSMHHFYRNRLVRAFLGATRRNSDRMKTANPFTNFDMSDDVKLSALTNDAGYFGPYPILNTALNASSTSSLDRQDRKAESFTFSPLYCGFDFSMTRASADVQTKSYDYGYRPTERFAYGNDGGPAIGTAMAISGAAVNPNQGFHSSPATAFLLTVFNVQMGWWMGNPRKSKWQMADPEYGLGYIFSNLTGSTNTRQDFVCLSDGGHFDNMGLYELVRRRCTFIVLGDGEQDDLFTCEGLANAIRRCRIDFGAEIDIDVAPIRDRDEQRFSKSQYALGCIRYAGEEKPGGVLLYIKSSLKLDMPVDVQEYALKNSTFPHQTTADQFFDESQFESYRQLGFQIVYDAFRDNAVVDRLGLMRLQKSESPRKPSPADSSVLTSNLWARLKEFFKISRR